MIRTTPDCTRFSVWISRCEVPQRPLLERPLASTHPAPDVKATPSAGQKNVMKRCPAKRVVWWPRTGGHCHPAVPHLRESTATVPSVNTPFSFVVTLPKARRGMLLQRVLRRVNLCCAIFILVFPACSLSLVARGDVVVPLKRAQEHWTAPNTTITIPASPSMYRAETDISDYVFHH
jgi:hypothetical protein